MDLELDIVRSGRKERPLTCVAIGEVLQADLALFVEERGTQAEPIKKLRERHHALARLLAEGFKDAHVATVLGYTVSRVSILKSDPTVKELIQFYRENKDAQYVELHEILGGMSKDAALSLWEELEEAPEKFSATQRMEMVKLGADRTGHGPQSSSTHLHLHHNLAERLQAARQRITDRGNAPPPSQDGPVIEGEIVEDEE